MIEAKLRTQFFTIVAGIPFKSEWSGRPEGFVTNAARENLLQI